MRIKFFQILFLNMLLSVGCQNANIASIKIKPLHPFSSSPHDYNPSERKNKSYIIKFYFIEGATQVNDVLSKQVDSFILKHIKSDTDFVHFGGYNLRFYRKTKIINEDFREQIDGMINYCLLDEYDKDLLFEYLWSDKDFMGCNFYKDGKIVKTIYDKGQDILKRNPALPLFDTGKVNIKEKTE